MKHLFFLLISLMLLFLVFSCKLAREATRSDNRNIAKIIKDGNFLYHNFLVADDIDIDENRESYIYRIKLRADEEYDYNTIEVVISKERKTFYLEVEYTLFLSQSKGTLEIKGELVASDNADSFVDRDIIKKLVSNTDSFKSIILNGERLKPDTVDMDVF